MSFWSKVIH